MKKGKKIVAVIVTVLAMMFVLTGCNNSYITQSINIDGDFKGTRQFTATLNPSKINEGDGTDEVHPIPYYLLRLHGDELAAWLQDAYDAALSDPDWLTVSVDPIPDDKITEAATDTKLPKFEEGSMEYVKINISFNNFAEYRAHLRAMAAMNGGIISKVPEYEGLSWRYNEDGKTYDFYYKDPMIVTFNGGEHLFEQGVVTKFATQPIWDSILADKYDATNNIDGVYDWQGVGNPYVKEGGNNDDKTGNLVDGAFKFSTATLNIKQSATESFEIDLGELGGEKNYMFSDIFRSLNGFTEDSGVAMNFGGKSSVTTEGNFYKTDADVVSEVTMTASAVPGANNKATVDTSKTNWYEVKYTPDGMGFPMKYKIGKKIATGATFTTTIDKEGDYYYLADCDGYATVCCANAVKYADVTFKNAAGDATIATARYDVNKKEFIDDYDLNKAGYRFTTDNDLTNITADTTVTVTYIKQWTVTFKDGDTVLKTVVVDEGAGVAEAAVPAPTKDGYVFKGWDKSFDAVTGDITVTAQFDAAKKKGCGSSVVGGVAVLALLALAGATVLLLRRRRAK